MMPNQYGGGPPQYFQPHMAPPPQQVNPLEQFRHLISQQMIDIPFLTHLASTLLGQARQVTDVINTEMRQVFPFP
jgi:hypothetical protein